MPPLSQFAEFAGNHPVIVSGLLGSLILLIFSEFSRKARALIDLPPAEVVRLVNQNGIVIDARTEQQFDKGHLAGAQHIPASELTPDSDKLKRYKDKPVVIVCETGMASSRLAGSLRKQGFADVFSLKGGLDAWQRDSLPLVAERKEKKSKQKKNKKQKS